MSDIVKFSAEDNEAFAEWLSTNTYVDGDGEMHDVTFGGDEPEDDADFMAQYVDGYTEAVAKARGQRRVRTPEGAKKFGQPMGTIITRDMLIAAARKAARRVSDAKARWNGDDRDSKPSAKIRVQRKPRPNSAKTTDISRYKPAPPRKPDAPKREPRAAVPGERVNRYLAAMDRRQGDREMVRAVERQAMNDMDLKPSERASISRKARSLTGLPEQKRPRTSDAETVIPDKPAPKVEPKKPAAKRPAAKRNQGIRNLEELEALLGQKKPAKAAPRARNQAGPRTREALEVQRRREAQGAETDISQYKKPPVEAPKAERNQAGPRTREALQAIVREREANRPKDLAARQAEETFIPVAPKHVKSVVEAKPGVSNEPDAKEQAEIRSVLEERIERLKTVKPEPAKGLSTLSAESLDARIGRAQNEKELESVYDSILVRDDIGGGTQEALIQAVQDRFEELGGDMSVSDPEYPEMPESDKAPLPMGSSSSRSKRNVPYAEVLPELTGDPVKLFEPELVRPGPVVQHMEMKLTKDQLFILGPKSIDKADGRYQLILAENVEDTPAAKVFNRGGSIQEILDSDPEGLHQYMVAHPERFSISAVSGGASGAGAFEVFDNELREMHFFKTASNDSLAAAHGDGANEVLAAKLGHEAFPDIFLNADFASRPEFGGNPLIHMDHILESVGKRDGYDAHFEAREVDGDPFASIQNPLAIHIFDYLANNTDRHQGNYGWYKDSSGKNVLIPTDHGMSFNAYDIARKRAYFDEIFEESVAEPENLNYGNWIEENGFNPTAFLGKQSDMMSNVGMAWLDNGGTDAKLKKAIKEVVGKFRKVDAQKHVDDLLKKFPDMDEYERKHLQAAAKIWNQRVSFLDESEFFDSITRRTYWNREAEGFTL